MERFLNGNLEFLCFNPSLVLDRLLIAKALTIMNEFNTKMDRFLEPVTELLSVTNTSCEVHWLHPNEPELNSCFSLAAGEAGHYASSMISQGFFAGIRRYLTERHYRIEMTFWEEWDGEFVQERWPTSKEQPDFEAVWRGFKAGAT